MATRDRKALNIESPPRRRPVNHDDGNCCTRCCVGTCDFFRNMVWKNFGQVFIMALGFLTLNTSYETCELLATRVLKSAGLDWMSKWTLTILSLSSAIASFFMVPVVQSIGKIRNSMFYGAICYSIWIWTFLVPVYYREEK